MRLTGKALEAFKGWFEIKYGKHYSWKLFIELPESMQWGILQDWADSIKILIKIDCTDGWDEWYFDIYLEDCLSPFFLAYTSYDDSDGVFKTRQEARKAAIEKLNEIVNEK